MREQHRKKLLSLFEDGQEGVIYLKGATVETRHNTDFEYPFRQESNFWYLTGVDEPDFHLILDLEYEEYHLFAPEREPQYAVWNGYIKSLDTYQKEYNPDHLHYDSELDNVLHELDPDVIYCSDGQQAGYLKQIYDDAKFDTDAFNDAIAYARCLKSDWELDQLREAGRINNTAHKEVLKALEPGRYEYEMKAVFDYHNLKNGLLQEAYDCIFAAGENSAILHYTNLGDKLEDGELFLIDAGYEYNGYSSDLTRTYPANGTFTELQTGIYQAVLNAQKEVLKKVEPGVSMEMLHMTSARVIIEGLRNMDLVRGDIDELMENDIFALFYPHGLGHFLGLDTHDVGGYPKGIERIDRPGLKYLRVRRTLEPDMVLTVEPGCYIIPALLEPAFEDDEKSRFLNREKLRDMLDFGGVRIEDNIIITDEGFENMTGLPKEIDEIEEFMAG